ncbi:hypothetical protein B0H14DRAFT_3160203 [Mycena olivaceomarginata]|nr:hypothetical protein B0H14DRAFT_3160203 [Mycena olivaceomarginata]
MYKTNVQEIYKLPTDKKEREHQIWNILFGGLNAPALHEAINSRMAVRDGPPPAVLDVGWRLRWRAYIPQAQILGVDLAIDPGLHYAAPNVQFKQLDITHGFPPTPGGYTIIHARVVTGHLKDPTAFVQAAFAELKPDQLAQHGSRWAVDSSGCVQTDLGRQVNTRSIVSLVFMIQRTCRRVDLGGLDGSTFGTGHERYLVPMHPSNDTEEREGLGAVSNSITLGFCHAGIKPFVATGQFTRTQVEEWIRLIQREFETKPIYMAWDIACGVKSS